jgi:hypothetical protein
MMCEKKYQNSRSNEHSNNLESEQVKLRYHPPLMALHPMKNVIQGGVGDMAETEGAMGS